MSELIPPALTYPGVYVAEAPSSPFEGCLPPVGVAAFIGSSKRGRPFAPTIVLSVDDFEREFVGPAPLDASDSSLAAAVHGFFINGGERLVVVRSVDPMTALPAGATVTPLLAFVAACAGEWANGLRVELDADDANTIRVSVVDVDGSGGRHVMEAWPDLSLVPGTPNYLATVLARDSEFLRVADGADGGVFSGLPADLGVVDEHTKTLTLNGGDDGNADAASGESALTTAVDTLSQYSDLSLLAVPGVSDVSDLSGVLAEVNRRDDLVLLLDGPQSQERLTAVTHVQAYRSALGHQPNVALYTPWVVVDGPGGPHSVPPSGLMAGVIARTDIQRGVFHTPAGLGAFLQGTAGLQVAFDDSEQAPLNAIGVNVIRSFPDAGVVAWGARTLAVAQDGSEHLPVHRMAQYVRKAVVAGTASAVFEAQGPELWARITQSVGDFLQGLFQQGALAGVVPTDSYRVQCDAENNPPEQVELGILTIIVEFAMFRIGAFQTVVIEHVMADQA